ncbi:succinyl-CoA:(R)-citramalate CoA-transferase [Solirubrobacter pauli]|uniref:Succinyl-CoA:(R)-citramalate CoA-transferase n=1 Tax=Solirubrobacter pauli TaxID=166793 RepID=A0A660L1Q2_9ACTN|nr:CoA transferase [Solirubrobacter pauli]RKQ87806.1 succinyl-CoA:(R)-citramalate CoA-transferase [Solirubrobacter pauli]
MADAPLTGLRAIEFGQLLAGPFTGTLLGDFGADVIKIEAPGDGDAMRDWGRLRHNDRSLWWSILARNKRSVALNLREPEGQRIAADLAAGADIVLENFRPGTMEKWGLGPEDLHARNPGLIYARVSGYGQTGRYRDRPGFASAGEAISGLRHINGYPDQAPPRSGISLGDTLAAQSAFQGILLALIARANGAEGQVVDASIVDACFAMSESSTLEYEKTGFVRQPTGPRLPRIAPSNVYRSKDGKWVVIAANHDTLWRRLAKIMGQPELGEDERFATHHARGEHEDLLDEIIGAFAAEHTADELDEIVNGGGVVCAPVYTAEDVYQDPYFRERELLVEVEDEVHGRITVPGIVPKLSRTPGSIRQAARWTVGADTDAVLEELGRG